MILTAVLVYIAAIVLTVLYGGLHISEISVVPIAFAAATIFTAFIWKCDEAADTTNLFSTSDAELTHAERHTMMLECAKVLKLSIPLQLLLIFTWADLAKGFFSFFLYFIAMGIGFHLGRRKVCARPDEK